MPTNIGAYSKALAAVAVGLVLWANQRWGFTLPVDLETWTLIITGLITAGVVMAPKNTVKSLAPVLLIGVVGLALTACTGNGYTFGPTGQQQLDIGGKDDQSKMGSEASVSPFQWSPPNYAGMTAGRLLIPQPDGRVLIAEVIDGKERGGAEIMLPLGSEPGAPVLSFNSTDSKAFSGQQIRAEVEKAAVAQYGQTWESLAPQIRTGLEAVIKGVCAALGVPC